MINKNVEGYQLDLWAAAAFSPALYKRFSKYYSNCVLL